MKKILYVLAGIILLLIITNPGYSSFTKFLGAQEFKTVNRKANLLVCSIYAADDKSYFAIFNGFYTLNKYNNIPQAKDSLRNLDSMTTESPLKTAD